MSRKASGTTAVDLGSNWEVLSCLQTSRVVHTLYLPTSASCLGGSLEVSTNGLWFLDRETPLGKGLMPQPRRAPQPTARQFPGPRPGLALGLGGLPDEGRLGRCVASAE